MPPLCLSSSNKTVSVAWCYLLELWNGALEYWTSDTVSNLPGEIHHLYEEIQAKDRIIQDCRNTIASRDGSIQKWIRMNGAGQPNPKQESYCKIIRENYEKAEKIQAEKIAMAEKAALLVSIQPFSL